MFNHKYNILSSLSPNNEVEFEIYNIKKGQVQPELIIFQSFITKEADLNLDDDIEHFILAKKNDLLVGCIALAGNVVKCIAVKKTYQGKNISRQLVEEITILAAKKGIFHLFIYTKPNNVPFFKNCGFHLITQISDKVALLENNPNGIKHYCSILASNFKEGGKIGSIVMNANPFTYGHQYLIEQAAKECDWLHLFIVSTDISQFCFDHRFKMVCNGIEHIDNISTHVGGNYIISRATFPDYFHKDTILADNSFNAIDLTLFRQYVAPALGITHRFVGSEPFCKVTKKYNSDMHTWLEDMVMDTPSIEIVEINRKKSNLGIEISASFVRKLIKNTESEEELIDKLSNIVPKSTINYCLTHAKIC